MEKLMTILVFIAEWLLYIYPLYQGTLELTEQRGVLAKFAVDYKKTPKVPAFYWFFPPLKVYLEQKRARKIIKSSMMNLDTREDLRETINFSNKATAWFYVSLAGVFKGVDATYNLFNEFFPGYSLITFWITVSVIFILGTLQVAYRHKKSSKIETILIENKNRAD